MRVSLHQFGMPNTGFNSKRCDYEISMCVATAISLLCFNSKRCDYESICLNGKLLTNCVSIPKGAIMSKYSSKNIKTLEEVSIPKGAIMRSYAPLDNSPRNLFQFQKVRL